MWVRFEFSITFSLSSMALWARSPLTLLVFARGSSSVVRAGLVVDVETSCGQVIMGRFAARPHVARMLAAGLRL